MIGHETYPPRATRRAVPRGVWLAAAVLFVSALLTAPLLPLFDPDEGYNGEHSRIRTALGQLLPASRAAIPALLAAFERLASKKNPEFSEPTLKTLRKLGAPPSDLIPVLQRMRDQGPRYNKNWQDEWKREIDEAIANLSHHHQAEGLDRQ